MTNDADVTVIVQSLAEFEALKDRLADFAYVDDAERAKTFELFGWYRLGAGL